MPKRTDIHRILVIGSGVQTVGEQAFANFPSLRRVTLGNLVGESQTVRSGLAAHERVVTDGTHKVADGMKVDYARKGADAGVRD